MHNPRAIDYSAGADGAAPLQDQIVAYVRGIRGPRQNPVSRQQIVDRYAATPAEFTDQQITALCVAGRIRICARSLRSSRLAHGAYVYEAVNPAARTAPPSAITLPLSRYESTFLQTILIYA